MKASTKSPSCIYLDQFRKVGTGFAGAGLPGGSAFSFRVKGAGGASTSNFTTSSSSVRIGASWSILKGMYECAVCLWDSGRVKGGKGGSREFGGNVNCGASHINATGTCIRQPHSRPEGLVELHAFNRTWCGQLRLSSEDCEGIGWGCGSVSELRDEVWVGDENFWRNGKSLVHTI